MFYFDFINDKKILKSDIIKSAKHFFTTRESVITYKDLDYLKEKCEKNLDEISEYLEVEKNNIISPIQTHSENICIARAGEQYPDTDALIIENKDIAVFLNFADCTPIIIYDEKHNKGAVIHAGWRGTAASIASKTVKLMSELYNSSPKDITAIIGPAISYKNYSVDKPVFEAVKRTIKNNCTDYYVYNPETNKYKIDLKTINYHQLKDLGVLRIDKCDYCTYDSVDVFFSYRKENGITARHSAVLKLI